MRDRKFSIRSYLHSDKDSLIAVFRSNCPKYFHTSDEVDFVDFLDRYADQNFLVIEEAGVAVGCGGHYVRDDKRLVGIAWVMFTRNSLGLRSFQNAADALFDAIMDRIKMEPHKYDITINTTQVMEKLFRHYGFVRKSAPKAATEVT